MKLYIARHGEASFNAPSDAERPLTDRGHQAIRNMVAQAAGSFEGVEEIWSSYLVRAVQTASYFESALSHVAKRKVFISPDGDAERVVAELSKCDEGLSLLLVSHQPLVGELYSLLVHGDRYNPYPFMPGEVLILDMDYPAAGLASQVGHVSPS